VKTPLNGEKTHPLKPATYEAMASLKSGPKPRNTINNGSIDRLLREALIDSVWLPSPFKTHKGSKIEFVQLTQAGLDALAARPAGK